MSNILVGLLVIGAGGFFVAKQASIRVWTIVFITVACLWGEYGSPSIFSIILMITVGVIIGCGLFPSLRKRIITKALFKRVKKMMPAMSDTERAALEAGTVGWDAELFSGNPNFDLLLQEKAAVLTDEEQAFLDGPTTTLCRMLNDWDITHNHTDLPRAVWQYIKDNGFLGMIIPKAYGGLGLSASAQTSVLVKLYGCSVTAATTVSVPNSLGPAELLLKYGTDKQKEHYLPRLAKGLDIPCFALTSPNAGSDAASIPDTGVICSQLFEGKETLGVRLNWDKRYITLCPVATVIGLAFRLFDPDNLLGKGYDIGITCALIPEETPGVIKGRRHFPMNTGFLNGPTQGEDVFIPLDFIIGGKEMAGQGWRMLMECLSAGRAISLPSSAVGGMQAGALACGAYARVRRQFNLAIASFEGIEEPLARIASSTYLCNAALFMTAAAIDNGAKPSVAGAILKYHTTERARKVVIDAMDIHGGKGICLGPNNYLGRAYEEAVISITVEGANILTRNLIIFGQGAIRCHPYVFSEMESVRENDLQAFDVAFWGHTAFILSNFVKSVCFSVTNGRLTSTPSRKLKRHFQLIHRYSANLAFLTDFSMMLLGGKLKRKEKMSARLGDVLSNLYMASAVLQRFHQDGEPEEDLALVHWSCYDLFYDCEQAIAGVIDNFPIRWARMVLKVIMQPFGLKRYKPSDNLGHQIAKALTTPGEMRKRISQLAFCEAIDNCPRGKLEAAFHQICAVEAIEKRVTRAAKEGKFKSLDFILQIDEARQQGLLTKEEAQQLHQAEQARQQVIAVDDFDDAELRRVSAKVKAKEGNSSAVVT